MEFFTRFQALCDQKGVAMSTVLDRAGLSRGNLARWREGLAPKASTRHKLAEVLGVDPGALEDAPVPDLDGVDLAFYGDYRALSEDDKQAVRDFVQVMRARRAREQQKR